MCVCVCVCMCVRACVNVRASAWSLTQHGVVEGEAGGVCEELGQGVESARESVPQQTAPGHVGVDAVLDDLASRDGRTDAWRRRAGKRRTERERRE